MVELGKLRQDEDCHWYLIPNSKIKRFDKIVHTMEHEKLSEDAYSDWEDELTNCFDRFRLPGGPWKLDVIIES